MMTREDEDVVEVAPTDEPTRRRGRTIAIIAGICAVLLAIAVTNNALRDRDGSGPDERDRVPPPDFFSADRLDELTALPVERQAGRPLHYLNLSNDGSVTFGLCAGEEQLMHFTATTTSSARTRTTTEPCFGGFELTDSLKLLLTDLAARSGYKSVEVEVESRNRLSPIITVTRDGQPATYGIDGIRVGPTQTNLGDAEKRAYALDRVMKMGDGTTAHRVCAWFDTNQLSVDLADTSSGRIESWLYVGTPVLASITSTDGLAPGAAPTDLGPFLSPTGQVAQTLGGATLSGVCVVGTRAPYDVQTVEYYTTESADYPFPGTPQSLRGTPIIASFDGTVLS